MKILITGRHGFIAQGLARYLAHHSITTLGRDDLNVTDAQQVRQCLMAQHYDIVINCAISGRHNITGMDAQIYQDNLQSTINFVTNYKRFGCYINLGSGSEFDTTRNINQARESEIWYSYPQTSYAASKNAIARIIAMVSNAWTVRIFGCFDQITPPYHVMTKLRTKLNQGEKFFVTMDRLFDMISLEDLALIVEHIGLKHPTHRDINAVYGQKLTLSEIFRVYCKLHGFDPELIGVESYSNNHYTGNPDRLRGLPISLEGLEIGLVKHQ